LIAALKEISAAPERARHAPIRDALIEAAQNARIKAAEAAAERVRNSEKAAEVAERLRNLENEHAKAVETERNLADEEARLEKELQNRVEAFVHDAEKTLRELSDKVSNADRKAMEAALSEFKADPRSAAKGHDLVKVFDAARLRRK
jgi:predicted nuclease with TOPRIM domain